MDVALTRDRVSAAVDEYGAAWTAQDPARIAQLFAEDAVYVERPFDKAATFRGRAAIRAYWVAQICGKQSNIVFRHVRGEMVLDAERRVAVVKWLAEFDNFRFKAQVARKRVRFCQVAKLHFSADATQITYLEEYAQGTTGQRYNWPTDGLDAATTPDAVLWDMVRAEPGAFATRGKRCVCERCGEAFASRAQLFRHLRGLQKSGAAGLVCGADPRTGQTVNDATYDPPSKSAHDRTRKVCLCLSYVSVPPQSHDGGGDGARAAAGCVPAGEMEDCLARVLTQAAQQAFPGFFGTGAASAAPLLSIKWAAPPARAAHAAINVAAVSMPDSLVDRVAVHEIAARLDSALRAIDAAAPASAVTAAEPGGGGLSLSSPSSARRLRLRVRKCMNVGRGFSPGSRCEFERYEALVPRSILLRDTDTASGESHGQTTLALARRLKQCARFFSGTSRSFHNFTTISARVMAGGKKKTMVTLKRVRAFVLPEPWAKDWFVISVSSKFLLAGMVQKIVGAIVKVVRGDMTREELERAFRRETDDDGGPSSGGCGGGGGSAPSVPRVSAWTPIPVSIPTYPREAVYLVSPGMPRYEGQVKEQVCLSRSAWTGDATLGGGVGGACIQNVVEPLLEWSRSTFLKKLKF